MFLTGYCLFCLIFALQNSELYPRSHRSAGHRRHPTRIQSLGWHHSADVSPGVVRTRRHQHKVRRLWTRGWVLVRRARRDASARLLPGRRARRRRALWRFRIVHIQIRWRYVCSFVIMFYPRFYSQYLNVEWSLKNGWNWQNEILISQIVRPPV